jgi:glycosyltransferase involved in cell wall biosynthesis
MPRQSCQRTERTTGGRTIYRQFRVAALVPAYNEQAHIGRVISTMPEFVDHIIVVNDASGDDTAAVARSIHDERVVLIEHETNQGLGASLIDAHLSALSLQADISVVMAGDGQMDPSFLPALLDPIVDEGYDFTKGNRFFSVSSWRGMPSHRVFGNIVLSFMTKLATGYWNLFDPQNGYTAMNSRVQRAIDWNDVAKDYSFENDVLARLGLIRARLKDVDIPAVYGDEVSSIRLQSVVPDLLRTLGKASRRRFWLQYVVRSFSPVALFGLSGCAALLWSALFGGWVIWGSIGPAQASTGTVMLAVLPFLMGFQLVLAGLVLDIMNTPK